VAALSFAPSCPARILTWPMLQLTMGRSRIGVAAIDGGSPEEEDAAVDMRLPQRLRRGRCCEPASS
jgi:hypothetical protein